MKHKNLLILVILTLSAVIAFAISGCGKKGPPLPPDIKGQKILAPFNLKHNLKHDLKTKISMITLSWDHKTDSKNAILKPESFEVFMAKKTFDACTDCPFKFNEIKTVAMPLMKYTFELEKGFMYYFRVRASDSDNIRSPFSKTIVVELK